MKAPAPRVDAGELLDDLRRVRDIHHLPSAFPDEVLVAASSADPTAASWLGKVQRRDLTDIEFVTLDPLGSRDLDQAFALARAADGRWTLRYAIADVAAFVEPGGPIDMEAWRRVVTVYLPGVRIPLHPPTMSEGSASLLPNQLRPAVVWTVALDAEAELTEATVERAWVKSRAALDYESMQAARDAGNAPLSIELLADFGRLRRERELERGGSSLQLPAQEVSAVAGGYELSWRMPLTTEDDNAQMSLLTGMAAARLGLADGWAVLRTLPPPPDQAVEHLQSVARRLGVSWAEGETYGQVLAGLDRSKRVAVAFTNQAAHLFRGAGYHCVTPHDEAAADQTGPPVHAAMAAPYSHVTAPLRRLGDRYATELVLSATAGHEPPEWATSRLVELPEVLQAGLRVDAAVDRSVTEAIEAALFAPLVGKTLDGLVVDASNRGSIVMFEHPPAESACGGSRPALGSAVRVRVDAVDKRRWETRLSILGGGHQSNLHEEDT